MDGVIEFVVCDIITGTFLSGIFHKYPTLTEKTIVKIKKIMNKTPKAITVARTPGSNQTDARGGGAT